MQSQFINENCNEKSEVILCGTLTKLELYSKNKGNKRYRAEFSVSKGVLRRKDIENNIDKLVIPVMIQNIVVISPEEDLLTENEEGFKSPAIGTADDLQIGKRYYVKANFCKIRKYLSTENNDEKSTHLVTHLDVKEIYEVSDKVWDENIVRGKFRVYEVPKVTKTKKPTEAFSRLYVTGLEPFKPRTAIYGRGKYASYMSILKEDDILELTGTLYPTQHDIKGDGGTSIKTDAFSIYLTGIMPNEK